MRESSDVFPLGVTGLSQDSIKELPLLDDDLTTTTTSSFTTCVICLQDMKDEEVVRLLPRCKHIFHLNCIDQWLKRQATCPICRREIFLPKLLF